MRLPVSIWHVPTANAALPAAGHEQLDGVNFEGVLQNMGRHFLMGWLVHFVSLPMLAFCMLMDFFSWTFVCCSIRCLS